MNGRSAWAMLYMLHNALTEPEVVYITYDIDYIAKADADQLQWTDSAGQPQTGLRDLKSIWMDAGAGGSQMTADGGSINTSSYSPINPIFNTQRGFGHTDNGAFWGLTGPEGSPLTTVPIENNAGTGLKVCTFPRENCASFDSSQRLSAQQGVPKDNIIGRAVTLNDSAFGPCPQLGENARCGVLINMGGHLHPGGLRDEVSLKRGNKIVPIHISDAVYWGGANYNNPDIGGAPPVSWDMSMTGVLGLPAGDGRAKDSWKILVRPGDKLILNGVYDTNVGSAYDQMAIVMSWVHPGWEADAIDPIADDVIFDAGWAEGSALSDRPAGLPSAIDRGCAPGVIRLGDADAGENNENVGKTRLCLRGNVTHGSMPSRQQHADCELTGGCPPLTDARIPLFDTTITMQGFTYGQMDLGIAQTAGIPQVPLGETLRFENPDLGPMVWHTVTACPEPCTGRTSASYPYPASYDTPVDFDSTILGAGLGAGTAGASGLGVLNWEYTPPQKGMYTFFCRIHPFMRGAFEVI
jgi:plastocyanin